MHRIAKMIAVMTLALGVACAAPASASISFDFESTPAGFYSPSLSVTQGSLTLIVTTEGNPDGFVHVGSESVPALLGRQAVIGSNTDSLQFGQFTPLRFSFSSPVDAITFAFGDLGGDSDSPVTIQAFNASDTLLATLTDTYPADFAAGKLLSGTFSAASYFIVSSGSEIENENSVFWEVKSVTPTAGVVPEPATLIIWSLLSAGGWLGMRVWRSRRRPAGRQPWSPETRQAVYDLIARNTSR